MQREEFEKFENAEEILRSPIQHTALTAQHIPVTEKPAPTLSFKLGDMRAFHYLCFKDGKLHIFLPFCRSALIPNAITDAAIGGDNTCQVMAAWKDFWADKTHGNIGDQYASVLYELHTFKEMIELFLSITIEENEEKRKATQWLQQVNTYVTLRRG